MDYSYEENEACDKANESMPPPAVPSLKMNGTKNRDITQEKADTALSSDVDNKHLEDAKQKIEEDQAGKDIKYNQFKKILSYLFFIQRSYC